MSRVTTSNCRTVSVEGFLAKVFAAGMLWMIRLDLLLPWRIASCFLCRSDVSINILSSSGHNLGTLMEKKRDELDVG